VSLLVLLAAHTGSPAAAQNGAEEALDVLVVETFLADIARNVAGDRIKVAALLPIGAEPHSFQPTPADVARVAGSNVLIVHGAGVEEFLDEVLSNAGGARRMIVASTGLKFRNGHGGEVEHHEGHDHQEGDPHFWLSPQNALTYVRNIRDGLSDADPAGATVYRANADAYMTRLQELDRWISDQVKQVPEEKRVLVTNHESFGYFADRYGFRISGTIMPGASTGASPSARELAQLIKKIKATGTSAIFLETGSNPRLAGQVARETGIKVVTELYTHSITEPGGAAPTYIEMMKYNTSAIVNALK
jgi:ABC-type Zn uptake system ZnuABC Zn-binding protein ZnuA